MQIDGLTYIADYIDERTHDVLLASADAHPWLNSVDHGVQIYGYRYSKQSDAAFKIGDLPEWSVAIAKRLQSDGLIAAMPNQLVANEYPPGSGIFDHVDQSAFGDTAISLSLGSTCVMRFTDPRDSTKYDVLLQPRSVIVLTGDARWKWTHSIPARHSDLWEGQELIRGRRVSLTFRAVPAGSS